jgi:hypothetical protein
LIAALLLLLILFVHMFFSLHQAELATPRVGGNPRTFRMLAVPIYHVECMSSCCFCNKIVVIQRNHLLLAAIMLQARASAGASEYYPAWNEINPSLSLSVGNVTKITDVNN